MKQVTMPVAWPPARMASLGNGRQLHRLGDRTSGSRSKNDRRMAQFSIISIIRKYLV